VASTGRIAVKLENLTRNSKFGYSRAKVLNTAQENLSSFYIASGIKSQCQQIFEWKFSQVFSIAKVE